MPRLWSNSLRPVLTWSIVTRYLLVSLCVLHVPQREAHSHLPVPQQDGNTPLATAVKRGHTGTVELLLKAGAKMNVVNKVHHKKRHHTYPSHSLPATHRLAKRLSCWQAPVGADPLPRCSLHIAVT